MTGKYPQEHNTSSIEETRNQVVTGKYPQEHNTSSIEEIRKHIRDHSVITAHVLELMNPGCSKFAYGCCHEARFVMELVHQSIWGAEH